MSKQLPLNHLAIIPDGNTRWAKANGLTPFDGYRKGAERGFEIFDVAYKHGVNTLTFWGLSTENWRNRPDRELKFLVKLFVGLVDRYIKKAINNGIKITHLGSKDNLPQALLDKVAEAEEKTKGNDQYYFNIALDYGGQDEILRATRAIIQDVKAGKLSGEDLDKPIDDSEGGVVPTVYSQYLDTAGQPYPFPDFVIRTSGETRLSGFMPWQAVYAELYFEPVFWPDFTPKKLELAIKDYYNRQRRFGGGHESLVDYKQETKQKQRVNRS